VGEYEPILEMILHKKNGSPCQLDYALQVEVYRLKAIVLSNLSLNYLLCVNVPLFLLTMLCMYFRYLSSSVYVHYHAST